MKCANCDRPFKGGAKGWKWVEVELRPVLDLSVDDTPTKTKELLCPRCAKEAERAMKPPEGSDGRRDGDGDA